MVIVVPIPMAWRRVRTEAKFTANNPWGNGEPTPYSLESYVSVPAWRKGTFPKVKNPPFLTIKSAFDGRERPVPASLAELFRTREIPAEAIPELLRDLEPRLKKRDYESVKPQIRGWKILIAVLLTIAAACYALYWTSARSLASRGLHAVPQIVSVDKWLDNPWAAESVILRTPVKIKKFVPTNVVLKNLPDVAGYQAGQHYALAAVQGKHGDFLVLLPGDPPVGASRFTGGGVVMVPTEIGFSPSDLSDLRLEFQDSLDTSHIFCVGWRWRHYQEHDRGEDPDEWFRLAIGFVVLSGLVALAAVVIVVPPVRRQNQQIAWVRDRVNSPATHRMAAP